MAKTRKRKVGNMELTARKRFYETLYLEDSAIHETMQVKSRQDYRANGGYQPSDRQLAKWTSELLTRQFAWSVVVLAYLPDGEIKSNVIDNEKAMVVDDFFDAMKEQFDAMINSPDVPIVSWAWACFPYGRGLDVDAFIVNWKQQLSHYGITDETKVANVTQLRRLAEL